MGSKHERDQCNTPSKYSRTQTSPRGTLKPSVWDSNADHVDSDRPLNDLLWQQLNPLQSGQLAAETDPDWFKFSSVCSLWNHFSDKHKLQLFSHQVLQDQENETNFLQMEDKTYKFTTTLQNNKHESWHREAP